MTTKHSTRVKALKRQAKRSGEALRAYMRRRAGQSDADATVAQRWLAGKGLIALAIALMYAGDAHAAPCVDAITDEPHETVTYEIDAKGSTVVTVPDAEWWDVAVHCGSVSLRGSRAPSWADDLLAGQSQLSGGTGSGFGVVASITFDPWGPVTIVIPMEMSQGMSYTEVTGEGEGYRVRVR